MSPVPNPSHDFIDSLIAPHKAELNPKQNIILLGLRGYFRDSMGKPGKNDRGIYDDAAFWVELDSGRIHQYNFNTDPSAYKKGIGTGAQKGMAMLKPGCWDYQMGIHKGYQAFVQADEVVVIRDGTPDYEDKGWFGINIHRGGVNSTSSLGCQTIPPAQWPDFKSTGYALLKAASQKTFKYLLMEQQG